MDLQLRGKTALVTGASAGIGRGIALALAGEGARLAVTARRHDKLNQLADDVVAAGGTRPLIIEQDMMAADAAGRVASAALAGLGSVGILVNNAGGSRSFTELHVGEAAWREAMTLNFERATPAGRGSDRRHDRARLGPHRQHHRQERTRSHQRRVLRQSGHAQLGQGSVAAWSGSHGITVNCIAAGTHPFRADPAQLHARIPAVAERARDPGGRYGEPRGDRRPGVLPRQPARELHQRHRHTGRRRPAALSILIFEKARHDDAPSPRLCCHRVGGAARRRARAIELAAPIDPLRRAVCAGRHFGDRGAHGGRRVDAPARPDRRSSRTRLAAPACRRCRRWPRPRPTATRSSSGMSARSP